VNDVGDVLDLEELAKHSLANPGIRRAEFFVRVLGFEKMAQLLGHIPLFLTVTCPGRMHAVLSVSGQLNPTFDGSSPADNHAYLCRLWAQIRSRLQRIGIHPYGFRIAEPHHDGTPHWHLLLFVPPDQATSLTETIRAYALADDPEEPGAQKHRFTVLTIDYSKGTAVAYLAKYISKNLDAFGIDELDGIPGDEVARRASAWASTWGIRQFQQIGGPPVTIWRELRRVKNAPEGLLSAVQLAADCGDWCEFLRLTTESLSLPRSRQPIKTLRIEPAELNAYFEAKPPQIVGVRTESNELVTRFTRWALRPKAISLRYGGAIIRCSNLLITPL
jgi:hypothetical protein